MTMAGFIFFTAFTVQLVAVTWCCSPVGPVDRYTPEETFEEADIIIYGKYVRDYQGPPKGEAPPFSSKHVIVENYCTMRSGNVDVPSNLTLNGNVMWHSCFHSDLEPNSTYLMTLSRHKEDPEGFFRVFEPNVASVGTFEASDINFGFAAQYCDAGMRNYTSEACYSYCTSAGTKPGVFTPSLLVLLISLFMKC